MHQRFVCLAPQPRCRTVGLAGYPLELLPEACLLGRVAALTGLSHCSPQLSDAKLVAQVPRQFVLLPLWPLPPLP